MRDDKEYIALKDHVKQADMKLLQICEIEVKDTKQHISHIRR